MGIQVIGAATALASRLMVSSYQRVLVREGSIYTAIDMCVSTLALYWFLHRQKEADERQELLLVDIKKQFPRDLFVALFTAHVLGWIAGSLATAMNPRGAPINLGASLAMSATSFGATSLAILASKSHVI